ncbi:MAG: cell division protein [Candidatus Andeanibacterium colombiense]|uniref:Cell division protein n=1 Tax=Candidatus Andeanibacterium colombiense TaxID=3121345 RepID=A0AAJ6BR63_9SPHN|nr:MAG: cell division protein [Sphingomonadaceae bacterium]
MPWVIAIMIALTTIAAAGGLALSNLADAARAELSGGLTVQIVEAGAQERDRQAELAVSLLSNRAGIDAVRRVPDSELATLIEPWLGNSGTAGDAIPIPALIDVRLAGPVTDRQLQGVRAALRGSVPAAQVDAQSSWLRPVFSAIASLQWLALGLVVLLAATSAAAVWLASRSALGSNRGTIEIVHLLGGTDGQIARIFQRSIGFDAVLGGTVGLGFGLAAILLLGRQFAALGSGMVAGGGLGMFDWAALAAIPILGVVIAMITARITVMAALRKML